MQTMNNDIKRLKVRHWDTKNNISWLDTTLTVAGSAIIIYIFHLAGAI